MKLAKEFYKLPLTFDIEQLKKEVLQFSEQDWTAHHESFKGNSAIPLVSVRGEFNNDFKGPMAPTAALVRCNYIQQAIASFGEVIGRSRLMRLAPGAEVPIHSDINYHWYKRVRIHIPIITEPTVQFHCADKQVHMGAGECWIFDSWKYHRVANDSDCYRVHLVIDIAGSSRFWNMVNNESAHAEHDYVLQTVARHLSTVSQNSIDFKTEKVNFPIIMPPTEVELLSHDLLLEIDKNPQNNLEDVIKFKQFVDDFHYDWRELWSQFECEQQGWRQYHQLREKLMQQVGTLNDRVKIDDVTSATKILMHLIIAPAMSTELATQTSKVSKPAIDAPQKPTPKFSNTSVSRNSPCHCGSGEKFKSCHGQLS